MNPISSMDEQFIKKLTQIIDNNLHNEEFGASELAGQLGISRVTLYRKVKSIIKKSVSEFIRETRLERALELLENKAGTVAEISYKVGFSNPVYFNKCFRDYYGVTPGDILKGNPVKNNGTKTSKKWPFTKKQLQFYSLTLLLIIVVLLVYLIVPPHLFHKTKNETTIVVLPFTIENTESKYQPYIEQIRDGIIQELKYMNGIEIISYDLMENYSDSLKNFKFTKRKKLKTDYLLEGTARTVPEGSTTIRINLINSRNGKILKGIREREIKLEGFDIKEMIDETIISIKNELQLYLSPDELEKKEMSYTNISEAHAMYERGLRFFEQFEYEKDFDLLYRSRDYFEKALIYDSTYVLPMEKLGRIIILNWHYENLTPEVFNRAMKYADNAIRINPNFTTAYCLKAILVNMLPEQYGGGPQVSLNLLEEALKIDANNWEIYQLLANNMGWRGKSNSEYAFLEYLIKAYKLNPDPKGDLFNLLQLSGHLRNSGYYDASYRVMEKIVIHYPDSMRYFNQMLLTENRKKDVDKAVKYGLKALSIDPNDLTTLDYLATTFLVSGDYKNALRYYQQYFEIAQKDSSDLQYISGRNTAFGYEPRFPMANYGYTLMVNNKKEKAYELFELIIDYRSKTFNIDTLRKYDGLKFPSIVDLLELALVYSALGETEKAMELFDFWIEKDMDGWPGLWRDNPLMENIKNEPRIIEYCNKFERQKKNDDKKIKRILIREGLLES